MTRTASLSGNQIDQFVEQGFLHIESAFPSSTAKACVDLLWQELETRHGLARANPDTWTSPVIRLDGHAGQPFVDAANTPRLVRAFDQLAGVGRWQRIGMGTFPIRFPSEADPGDAGWHIDGSYYVGRKIFANLVSRERALLMLFLFSDVAERDVPTRVRVGSHLLVPRVLAPYGEAGASFADVVPQLATIESCEVALATGGAGDVYLCHPFLVHAASWPHRGDSPRFIAQPPLPPTDVLHLHRDDGAYSPVEVAVRRGLPDGFIEGTRH